MVHICRSMAQACGGRGKRCGYTVGIRWLRSAARQVDALKLSMQNLTQDVKELQDRGEKGTLAL